MQVNASGSPIAICFEGEMRTVAAIQDRWRIDDEWWRETPVSRLYCQIQIAGGRVITIYHDLSGGDWWLQRY